MRRLLQSTKLRGPAVLIAAGIWLVLTASLWAAERASITTSIGGAIYYSDDAWIAVGGVTLTQGDTRITADKMKYDVSQDQAVFTGNVRVSDETGTIDGEHFIYDLEAESGRIEEAVAAFEIEGVDSPVYLLGEALEFSEGHTVVENARLTTCVPPTKAGYYLASRRMDIFPGDRLVIRNVRFIESGVTLFYWPYVSISLKEGRPSRLKFPEIGHNPSDGWYVKTRYAYDGPGEGYGEVALDWMQYKGIGTGVHHTYRSGEAGEGSVTVYRLRNRATEHTDLSLGWDEEFTIGSSLDGTWRSAYVSRRGDLGGEQNESRYNFVLDADIGGSSSEIEWEAKRLWGDETLRTDRLTLFNRGELAGWRWRAEADTFYLRPISERLAYGYDLNLRRSDGPYSLNVDVERRPHPRYFSEDLGRPSWRLRTSMPSVTLETDLAEAISPWLPVDFEVGWGRFSEARRVGSEYPLVSADRTTAAFRLQPGRIDLGRFGDLYYRAGIEYREYSTGSRSVILSANHQLRLPLGAAWSLYGGYSYQEAFGALSPFVFDEVNELELVTGRLQYSYSRGHAFLSSGYDFRTGLLSDLVGQVSYRPASGGLLALQGGYSLTEQRPTYAAVNVSLEPSTNFSVDASARYDFEDRVFDGLSAGLTAAYLGWKVEYDTFFDVEDEGATVTDLALVRDLGCREVGVRYSSDTGSIWLEYRITALPEGSLRFGVDRDSLLFDPDSLSGFFE